MNDRFKFRGVLTVEYGGDNADDKTVDLIIEKADAIYSGDIGFDIDQLDAAIEKAGITDDIEIDQIHEFCYDNNGCRSDEYFIMDGDIEQCTGLSDKNGNLIYEGDIVRCDRDFSENGRKNLIRKVIFADGSFQLERAKDIGDRYYINAFHNFEIIGNIHEQAEQNESSSVHNKIKFPEYNDNLLEEFDKQFFENGQDDDLTETALEQKDK